jgi:predicted DNA-binding protein (MmcQ/YjbR family)
MATRTINVRRLETALRQHALGFPESHEDFPWGERAIKVKGKVFVFMYAEPKKMHFTVKLPHSREFALMFPFAAPSGYGLGKSGWITARLTAGASAPLSLLKSWIDESYRAVAPKALVARLGDGSPPPRPPAKRRTKRKSGGQRSKRRTTSAE